MRIIAGKYGGRRLSAFKADHIRPTTDRVKETIFNQLQFDIEDAQVLDLFSGTGSLSFEALSRGAQSVVSVEMSAKSVSIIKKNKNLLGIGNELQILQMDVLKYLKSCQESFDIILVDPPFTKKMAHTVMEALAHSHCGNEGAQAFIESTSQERIDDQYGDWILKKRKSYGDKYLSNFEFNASGNG